MAKTRITKLDFVKQHDIHFYQATGVDTITLQSSNNNPCIEYKKGMIVYFIANGKNKGPIHIAIDDLAMKEAIRFDGTPFKGGETIQGSPYMWIYNGEKFQLLGSELSEIEKNIATLVARLDGVDKEITQLKNTTGEKINKSEVDELLGNFKTKLSTAESKINEVQKELTDLNSATKTEFAKSIEALKENIKTAFEKAGTNVSEEIKKNRTEIEKDYEAKIKASELKTIFGKDFDLATITEYKEGQEYKNNTVVKYNGEYAIVSCGELYLTGVNY